MSSVATLDSSLGLGGIGKDQLDTKGFEGSGSITEPAPLGVENTCSIAVNGTRDTVASAIGPERAHHVGAVL